MIRAGLVAPFWMGHKKSNHPHHFLHGAMRVIEKRSLLMHGKFVNIFFSRRDRFLANPRHAVLFDGNFQSMPVNRGRFGQFVFEDYTHTVALLHLNGRPWATAVVTPGVDGLEWRDFAFHWLGHQLEHFHAAIHFVRQVRQVRCDHWQERVRPSRGHFLLFGLAVWAVMAPLFDSPRRLRVAYLSPPQSLCQTKKSCAKKCRVLKKPSSRAAHSRLLIAVHIICDLACCTLASESALH